MTVKREVEQTTDAFGETVRVGDLVVYTVGDRASRRLQKGVVEKVMEYTSKNYWTNEPVVYHKVWIRHSPPKDHKYWLETGVSILEHNERFARWEE